MRRLPLLVLFLFLSGLGFAQSPHTDDLKIDCAECHNPVDWKVNPTQVKFDHSSTSFSLIGQHLSADCKSCHSSLVFNQASVQCISCHQDIHQNTVGLDCQKCHTPNSWIVTDIKQIHDESRFPLIGVHVNADCIQCHSGFQNLYFEPLSIDCYSCHQSDYNSTTSPNHARAGFSNECQDCHNIVSNSWAAENFRHDFFPLIGGHNISDCFSCHQSGNFTEVLSTECYSCHSSDYQQVQDPNHIAENYPTDCTLCHTINGWSPANFNHNNTEFPLTGAHSSVDCSNCHSQTYSGTSTACVSCHQDNYNAALSPNHIEIGISAECQSCHSTTAWIPSAFTHSSTGFELIGQHSIVDCSSCHEGTTSGLSQECLSCHQEDYNASLNPNHGTLSISTDCQVCHTPTEDWEPASFAVHNNYYELIGTHATIASDCQTCHNGNYTTTPNTCYGCHQADYENTNDPAHASAGFSTDCVSCHSQTAWTPATFDHDNQYFPIYSGEHREEWNACSDCHTNSSNFSVFSCIDCHEHNQNDMNDKHQEVSGYSYNSEACFACHPNGDSEGAFNHTLSNFPLTGAHTSVDCSQCHEQGYGGTSSVCYDCHQSNYNSASNPNHQALSISTTCSDCHTTESGWAPASFAQHNQYFEFTGAHIQISNDCSSCHAGNYNTTSSECVGCHQDNYQATQNPNHSAMGIATNCQACHSTTAWTPSSFDHQSTAFPLTGSHISTSCISCHESGFPGTPSECVACHDDSYNSTLNPNHQAAGISTSCQSCHTTTAWIPSSFSHASTGFELLGQHASVQCSSCHEGTTSGLDPLCISCHQDNYSIAPNHIAQSYPTTCEMCHNSVAWEQVTFNHQNTEFPLTGGHISVTCSSCHSGGFSGTTTVCSECHQINYNNSTNPSHTDLALSTNCETCHTTNPDWQPALFPVHNNYYQFLGAHVTIANNCVSCHSGDYNNTPNTCYGCHQTDYNSTNNPPHQSAGFPIDCESCHTQNAWVPSTFDHDDQYFPIYSGEHDGEWDECSDCHTEPNNFSVFSCIDCHEHNQPEMDDEHQEVSGYVYDSDACYDCHPDGENKNKLIKLKGIQDKK